MNRYSCYYCEFSTDYFKSIIDHLCDQHGELWLKYRELELDCTTGALGHRTRVYENIRPVEHDISVTSDDRVLIQNADRSKRKKMNTPKKSIEMTFSSNKPQKNLFDVVPDDPLCAKFDEMDMHCSDSSETASEHDFDGSHRIPDTEYDESETDMDKLIKCLPTVLDNLRKYGQADSFVKWCSLVSEDKMPLDNICYLLFLDLVEWYSKPITSQMRYFRNETRQFWDIGYRLFKGKFLRFMAGPRNVGQIVSGIDQRGRCDPANAKINFAIPALNNLSKDPLNPIYPGVLEESIMNLAINLPNKTVKLGIDGKKISRGKGKSMGDIDCWGFETKPTLQERKNRHQDEIRQVDVAIHSVSKFDLGVINEIPSSAAHDFLPKFKELILTLSLRIKDLRHVLLRLNQGIQKFLKMGESSGDWRKSRYAPVISCLKVAKYDTEQAIVNGLRSINEISSVCAKLNGTNSLYSYSDKTNMSTQQNYHQLKPDNDSVNTTLVKQRTESWHAIRSEAMVTGSTCNTAIGLGQLKKQQEHFDKVVLGIDRSTVSDDQRKNMEYGTVHENDAVATVVGRILPTLYPTLQYFEEGCVRVAYGNKVSFLVVSPDGSLKQDQKTVPEMMFEAKCKTSNVYTTDVYYEIPKYYITQLLCEMYAYNCNELLFTCWSRQSTTVFRVEFDEDLWQSIWDEMCVLYGSENMKRPTKFSDKILPIKTKISDFIARKISFLGEFPSCIATNLPENDYEEGGSAYIACKQAAVLSGDDRVSLEKVDGLLHGIRKWFQEGYQLCRTTATEILMFMVNDVDRKFHMEVNNSHPVAYALKGPSMSNEIFREMTNYVIQKCTENGLSVVATSSDGQWHKYGIRDDNNGPLTVIQLQKDLWSEIKSKPKSTLLKELRGRYKVHTLDDIEWDKKPNGPITVYGHKRDSNLTVYESPEGRFRSRTEKTAGQIRGQEKENCDTDQNESADGVGTLDDLTGFVPDEVASEFGEQAMEQIDRMLLKLETNLQYQTQSSAFADVNISSDLQSMFFEENKTTENTTVSRESELGQNTNASNETYQMNTFVTEQCPSMSTQEPYEGTEWVAFPLPETQVISNRPFVHDEQEIPISGALHTALATIYEATESQDAGNYDSMQYTFQHDQHESIPMTDNVHHSYDLNPSQNNPDFTQGVPDTTQPIATKECEYEIILHHLQRDENASKKNLWNTKTANDLEQILQTKESACETLTGKELKICIHAVREKREKLGIKFCNSWTKPKLYGCLKDTLTSEIHTLDNNVPTNQSSSLRPRLSLKSPQKLSTLVSKAINSIPKDGLACVIAEENWESRYQAWIKQSPVPNDITINDSTVPIRWFSKPNVDADNDVRFHFTDSCHILTCLRTKLCTSGINGLRKQAWERAAESDKTSLNIAIVVECLDKQSVAFATRMFAEDVEQFMLSNGYEKEAVFVGLIRRWFESEDTPGIPSIERCERRLSLRDYLLTNVKFGRFPPLTQYVNGIPIVTYEGLLTHLERKLQLYFFVPGRCYNTRAMGTQEVEQFFSCLRDLDPSGIGTPKPDDIPDMIATAAMIDNARIDPNRPFYMRTSRATVYPDVSFHENSAGEEEQEGEELDIRRETSDETSLPTIMSVDHFFDRRERKRVRGKIKKGLLSAPDKPGRGVRGVRQHHFVDESKVLAEYRRNMRPESNATD